MTNEERDAAEARLRSVFWEYPERSMVTLEIIDSYRAEVESLRRAGDHTGCRECAADVGLAHFADRAGLCAAHADSLHAELAKRHKWLADENLEFNAAKNELAVVRAELAALRARVAELEGLVYLGEHRFPDLTYKARLEELLAERDLARAELAALREVVNATVGELEGLGLAVLSCEPRGAY